MISTYDDPAENVTPFPNSEALTTTIEAQQLKDLYIIIVRIPLNVRKIVIKKANEELTAEEVVERVNSRIPNVELKIAPSQKHFIFSKDCRQSVTDCQEELLLMSKHFHKSMGFHRAVMYHDGLTRFKEYDFNKQFSNEWSISLIKVNDIFNVQDFYEWVHPLKSLSFLDHTEAVKYLNTLDSNVIFTLSGKNKVTVEIKKEETNVAFNPDLRDCLAFDKDHLVGKGHHVASGEFSLKRRISFLYVYSNVAEYCKVGDTMAPLLGIVPFEGKACETVQERIFQNPMYVPIRSNTMSFIEVLLCDGTGQTVPFTSNGKSVVCLHFKQV